MSEWRELCPMPASVRYHDTITERVILQQLPPKPEPASRVGCAAAVCVDGRFAQDEPSGWR
jgi:hypothetical protein